MRTCTGCGQEKHDSDFQRYSVRYKNRLRTKCRSCVSKVSWRYKLNYRYGISPERYEAMLKDQHGRCAICKLPESIPNRELAVDHDHNTNKVRGLLCSRCNPAIGLMNDDLKLIARAYKYIKAHRG